MHLHRVVAATIAALLLAGGGTALAAEKPINEKRIWKQRWEKAESWERQWAHSTSSCETGGTNDPHTDTGNGFLSAFQYLPSTWWDAPATGPKVGEAHQLPHHESWITQAVVSIKLMRRDGTEHWPNCG